MLLDNYRIKLQLPPCNPSAETLAAIVDVEDDLTDLQPYINAEMGPGVFDPDQHVLRLNRGGRAIVFHPHQIAISKLKDEAEAEAVFRAVRDHVRSIAERRDQIEPSCRSLGEVSALEVYKLLPQTKCKACGQPTCYIFASKLVMGHVKLEACPVLQEPQYAAQLAQLADMLVIDMP
ncbi:MAG TPA: hypothetical protein ENL35_04860, partial [Chloroflexi bacterium]|nr:hypothetical protein [Chloroflexota bacterium]